MAKIFLRDKQIVGIDISSTGVKIMAVDTRRWAVTCFGHIDLDPTKIKESLEGDSEYLADSIKTLIKEKLSGNLPSNYVALGLPTTKSYSRTFSMPLNVSKHLKEAVELEVDQYIPIPASTLYIDSQIIEKNKKNLTVLMSAMPRTIVDKALQAVESAGLNVVLIEPGISSVARLLKASEEAALPTVIVDIGPATTDIAVLDGAIRVTGGLAVGGNTFTINIARKLEVTLENAYQLKVLNGLSAGPRQTRIKSAVEPALKQILDETQKVMRYYNERISDDRKLEQLLVVGSGSNMPGVGEYFTNELMMPARVANPWQKLDFDKLPEPPRQLRAKYITVAGLAMISAEEIWK